METLGKEDTELTLNHPSEALLPFFQTLYDGGDSHLTDDNVLKTLKLAHKFDSAKVDSRCKAYLQGALAKLEALAALDEDELSLLLDASDSTTTTLSATSTSAPPPSASSTTSTMRWRCV
jgi:hypothetical protein